MRLGWTLAISLMLASAASATPALRAKNGHSIRILLGEKRQSGIGLAPKPSGWRLELSQPVDAEAEILDVTKGVAPSKWILAVTSGALHFDETRFRPGHAYRVDIRQGRETLSSGLVYLYPKRAQLVQRVQMDAEEESGDPEDMPTLPKGSL